ncbi:MAG: hypothetical protein IT302_04805 [Dehalococcoidia bacterium]|nr:hypothetical protein [Dehalococcoidia bacterium]
MATSFSAILYEVERGRARITPNRPEKLNARSRVDGSGLRDENGYLR